MRTASGGVKRLAGLAAAVVGRQRLLVLDEPTNDVDPVRRQLLWSLLGELRETGTTVLLVTHNLAEAERVIDRLAIIDRGRIVREGSPAGLRTVVTDQLRLEVTAGPGFAPHEALTPDPSAAGAFLFAQGALVAVSGWLQALREGGAVLDFRIGPPGLEDIYAAAVGNGRAN
jgi:ABC-type multidrug transport system ATPase subunit